MDFENEAKYWEENPGLHECFCVLSHRILFLGLFKVW